MFGESETRKTKNCYRRAIHHWITIDLRTMKQKYDQMDLYLLPNCRIIIA